MDARPIETEADYDRALKEIERYFDEEPEPGSPESRRFDVLAGLIEQYESRGWPTEPREPVEPIRQRTV